MRNFLIVIIVIVSTMLFLACGNKPFSSSNQGSKSSSNTSEWREVDSLEKKGLERQALKEVNDILISSIRNENPSSIFKCLAYKSKYISRLEESSEENILQDFEEYIEKSDAPIRQILHSALGGLYYNYLLNNQWRINNRTFTEEEENISKWNKEKLEEKAKSHFLESLTIEEKYKGLSIEEFDEILTQADSNYRKELRPTLFDFLAYRAIHYFQTNTSIQARLIDFQKLKKDSLEYNSSSFSNEELTFNIYEALLQFHKKQNNNWAYLHTKLNQLNNQKNYSLEFNLKDSIEDLKKQFKEVKIHNELDLELAKLFYMKGDSFISDRSLRDLSAVSALYKSDSILTTIEIDELTTYQLKLYNSLKHNISLPEFRLFLNQTYDTEKAIETKVEFRNIDKLEFYVYKSFDRKSYRKKEEVLEWIKGEKLINSFTITLPKHDDFNYHSIDLSLFKLPFGSYTLISKKASPIEESIFYLADFDVSNLAVMDRLEMSNGKLEFYIYDRRNGENIEGAEVVLKPNNKNLNSSVSKKKYLATSNSEGIAVFNEIDKNISYEYSVSYKNDKLDSKRKNIYYYPERSQASRKISYYFTDRSIYKEGQTVYFKGIDLEEKRIKNTLVTNDKKEVYLINPNGRYLDTLKTKSNEYGSFHGSFKLPISGLNGNYRIASSGGQIYFQVSDYKRPTYKIELQKTIKYENSLATIIGNLKAYSGEPIANGKIDYKVFLNNSYPSPLFRGCFIPHLGEKVLIENGSTTSNKNGDYKLELDNVLFESLPFKNLEIEIIARNNRGETINKNFFINEFNFEGVSLNIENSLEKDDAISWKEFENLIVESDDKNGEKVNKTLQLELWEMQPNPNYTLNTKWSASEYFNKDGSIEKREKNYISPYKRVKLISKSLIDCNEKLELFNPLKESIYQLILSDPKDSIFQLERTFFLFDQKTKSFPKKDFFWYSSLNTDLTKSDKVDILLGSSLDSVIIRYDIDYHGKIIESGIKTLSNSKSLFNYKPKQAFNKSFNIHFYIINNNHFEQKSIRISTKDTNKLDIKLLSFRDKTKPGSLEKYSLKIEKDQLPKDAELVASMYDASLDYFKNHNWFFKPNEKYFRNATRNSDNSFVLTYPAFYNNNSLGKSIPKSSFKELNWFGFNFGYNYLRLTAYDSEGEVYLSEAATISESDKAKLSNNAEGILDKKTKKNTPSFALRRDFRETAFFYPNLKTKKNGEIDFEFKVPESLTEWKLMLLAHSKNLETAYIEKKVVSQKELMVKVNAPKFFRTGDNIYLQAEIINITDEDLSAKYDFQIKDNLNEIIDQQGFQGLLIKAKSSKTIYLNFEVPKGVPYLEYEIFAESKVHQDGERKTIAVFPNKELVIKSKPFVVKGNSKNSLRIDEFEYDYKEPKTDVINYTLEYSPNQWCNITESLSNLIFRNNSNSIALSEKLAALYLFESIIKKDSIKELIQTNFKNNPISTLEKNPELKSILIDESPWATLANNSSAKSEKIIQLLNPYYLDSLKSGTEKLLLNYQTNDGSWVWIQGMKPNLFISEKILNVFASLKANQNLGFSKRLDKALTKSVFYLDEELEKKYKKLKKEEKEIKYFPTEISYLYSRSYINKDLKEEAISYYLIKALELWQNEAIINKAMLGQILSNTGTERETMRDIQASILDFILEDSFKGAYWKTETRKIGYQADLLQHCIAMNFLYNEFKNTKLENDLSQWLIFQKKNQMWGDNNASDIIPINTLINAQYNLNSNNSLTAISVGSKLDTSFSNISQFKLSWIGKEVNSDLAYVNIETNSNSTVAYGAAIWQSSVEGAFNKSQNSQLNLERAYYKEVVKEDRVTLIPIDSTTLNLGDKVICKLTIEAKSKQEFLHLRIGNPSALNPIEMISGLEFNNEISLYKEVETSTINYFFDQINKGTYVFEIPYLINHSGNYESGICSIQSQYSEDVTSSLSSKLLIIKDN